MKDLSGTKFGRLTAIRRLAKDKYGAYKTGLLDDWEPRYKRCISKIGNE